MCKDTKVLLQGNKQCGYKNVVRIGKLESFHYIKLNQNRKFVLQRALLIMHLFFPNSITQFVVRLSVTEASLMVSSCFQ